MLHKNQIRRCATICCALLLLALQNAGAQQIRPTTDLSVKRYGHQSVTLPNGKVLVMGGQTLDNLFQPVVYNSCVLFDPANEQWSPVAAMNIARRNFASVLTPAGKVLAIGGSDASDNPLTSVERYDPDTNTWTVLGNLGEARQDIDAIVIQDSIILVVGHEPWSFESSVNDTNWTLHEFQSVPWRFPESPALIELNDGRVLCVGEQAGAYPNWAFIFDSLNVDTTSNPLADDHPRAGLALLPDGKVLVAGGTASGVSEIFDPATNTFSSSGSLNTSHLGCPLMRLSDGRVAIFNVGNTFQDIILEIYNPANGQWTYQTGHNFTGTDLHSVSPIATGTYLISGGREYLGQTGAGTVKCFIFDETTGIFDKLPESLLRMIYDPIARTAQFDFSNNEKHHITFSGADGKLLSQYFSAEQQFACSLPEVAPGIYIVHVADAAGKSVFSKSLFIR